MIQKEQDFFPPQYYEQVNKYDFILPELEDISFKESTDFANIISKKVNYAYKDHLGISSEFVIAKGLSPNKFSNNLNQTRYLHLIEPDYGPSNIINQNEKDNRRFNYLFQSNCQQTKKRFLSENLPINANNIYQFEQQFNDPQDQNNKSKINMENYNKLIHPKSFINEDQFSKNINAQSRLRFISNSNSEGLNKNESLHNKQNFQTSPVQGFLKPTVNTKIKNTFQNFYSVQSSFSPSQCSLQRESSSYICPKMHRMQPQTIRVRVRRRSSCLKSSKIILASESGDDTNIQMEHSTKYKSKQTNISQSRQNQLFLVSKEQKHKFHEACGKFQAIQSFYDYMAHQALEENEQKPTQVFSNQIVLTNSSSLMEAQLNKKQQRLNVINKRNIQTLKTEQHTQLLKIVDAFQETCSIQNVEIKSPISDSIKSRSIARGIDFQVKLCQTHHEAKQPRENKYIDKVRSSSIQEKVILLRQTYKQIKQKTILEQHQLLPSVRQTQVTQMEIEQKQKLFACVDEGEEDNSELKFVKPKKFVKQQKINSSKTKTPVVSLVELVRQQSDKLSIANLHLRFGRSILKLFEFLQYCIRLNVCINDIIGTKVFTTKAYERTGSFVFFKMVKQDKLTSVSSLVKECRWRIFDFDHLIMTPLHIAAIKGFQQLAFFLIDQNPDLEAEDIDNKTPLYYALKHKHYDIAKYLLINKATPWANDNFRYYDIIDDPDMHASLKIARQLWIILKVTPFKKKKVVWQKLVNRILDPILCAITL